MVGCDIGRIIVGSVDIRMGDSWMYMRLSPETFTTEGKPDAGRGRQSVVGLTQDRAILVTPGPTESPGKFLQKFITSGVDLWA